MAQRRAITGGPPVEDERRRETAGGWAPQLVHQRADGTFALVRQRQVSAHETFHGPQGQMGRGRGPTYMQAPAHDLQHRGYPSLLAYQPPPVVGHFRPGDFRQHFGVQTQSPATVLFPPPSSHHQNHPQAHHQLAHSTGAIPAPPMAPPSSGANVPRQLPALHMGQPLPLRQTILSLFGSGILRLGPGASLDMIEHHIMNSQELLNLRDRLELHSQITDEHKMHIHRLTELYSTLVINQHPTTNESYAEKRVSEQHDFSTPRAVRNEIVQSGVTYPVRRQPPTVPQNMRRENSAPTLPTQHPFTTPGHNLSGRAAGRQMLQIAPIQEDTMRVATGAQPIGEDGRAHFAQKSTSVAFNEIFTKLEAFVRNFCTIAIIPAVRNYPAQRVVDGARAHVNVSRAADEMLTDQTVSKLLLTGIVCHHMTKHLFEAPFFDNFNNELVGDYIHWWNQAEIAYRAGPEYANRVNERLIVHSNLAQEADKVIAAPGFWSWAQLQSHVLAKQAMDTFKVLIPHNLEPAALNELKHIYNLAVRLDVRLRADPFYYSYDFYTHGVAWDWEVMVQRNPELAGQKCDQQPSIHVVRCCVIPQVKVRQFNDPESVRSNILRKAEVLLCPRDKNLRKGGRPKLEFRL
ncbi:hypothetical protein K431DRAFT_316790 [Polychaeton citri CBS 116435]|uniref:Uncharacterized protein n=1 Tax=Polychaeton citri CBS 116435 TaxID=1314669 RepID=A0A9P4PYE2_9PEZI|nr:hypothetical protein K431DRAFT_316790 [Polychaeton citri CBS 116435]